MQNLLTIDDFHQKAISLLPKLSRDYYESGSDEEKALRRNRRAFSRLLIRPKCLVDVSKSDTNCEFLGKKFKSPIAVAPTAFHKLCHPRGELASVEGISRFGGLMICSSWGTTPLEEIAENRGDATLWFQLYVYKDRPTTEALIRRAENAGFEALVLTVDTPVLGRRLADKRNAFTLPPPLKFANMVATNDSKVHMPKVPIGDSGLMAYVSSQIDQSLNWDSLKWLVGFSRLPVIVKGIMRSDDALKALQCGAKGIIVSNHGGRQMDCAPATIEALPEIAKVAGQIPVFLDGGIRNGRDVFKALALGASGIFIGRAILYGLTVGGADGVERVLDILQEEFEHCMKLAGCQSIADIRNTPQIVVSSSHYSKL
ncbi:unnamed protein product, partial [Mesorhabditis belari]|uniref:FMN hydroxy acid dehydrogenase domain-containing protein n=1 Tax=Mesorhabditis belari TaxID=2138241 RepID=A0AAF3EW08_9BILA